MRAIVLSLLLALALAASWLVLDGGERAGTQPGKAAPAQLTPDPGPVVADTDATPPDTRQQDSAPPPAEPGSPLDTYLAREQARQRMFEYFEDPQGSGIPAEEIRELIDHLEQGEEIVAAEAMSMKLLWLKLNSADEEDYLQAAQALREAYRERWERNTQRNSPTLSPAYTDYKTREATILAEMAQRSFPDAQARDDYLREKLLEARKQSFGQ